MKIYREEQHAMLNASNMTNMTASSKIVEVKEKIENLSCTLRGYFLADKDLKTQAKEFFKLWDNFIIEELSFREKCKFIILKTIENEDLPNHESLVEDVIDAAIFNGDISLNADDFLLKYHSKKEPLCGKKSLGLGKQGIKRERVMKNIYLNLFWTLVWLISVPGFIIGMLHLYSSNESHRNISKVLRISKD